MGILQGFTLLNFSNLETKSIALKNQLRIFASLKVNHLN